MKRDLTPSDFAGLLESHRQRSAEQRFVDEHNPSPRKRWGFNVVAAVLAWLFFLAVLNVPAIFKFFFN